MQRTAFAIKSQTDRMTCMILRAAGWMTMHGIVIGLGGALALGRIVTSLLYGLKASDMATLGAASA